MPNQRRPKRDTIEYYLTRLLLEYRRFVFAAALFLLVYSVIVVLARSSVALLTLPLTVYLLLLSAFDSVVVYSARLLSWLLTLGSRD